MRPPTRKTTRWLIAERIFDDGERELADLAALMNLRRNGACVGMESSAFFPARGGSAAPAKAACQGCPVRAECLTYAIEHREWHGVWGGYSEKERRAMNQLHARGLSVDQVVTTAITGGLDEEIAQKRKGPRIPVSARKSLPYGWRAEGDEMVHDDAEQAVIEQMRSWALAGASPAEVATRLNAQGALTRFGVRWQAAAVVRLLNRASTEQPSTDQRRAS